MRKRKHIKVVVAIIISISASFVFEACGNHISVVRTAELRGGNATGPINFPPVFFTSNAQDSSFKIAPHLEVTPVKPILGNVKARGTYDGNSQNFTWNFSKVSGGFNMEINASRSFALTGSISLSSANNVNGSAGIAIINSNDNITVRLDGGVLFSKFNYDVHSIVIETISGPFPSTQNTYYFHDKGNSTSLDFYVSIMLNGANENNFLNYFVSFSYFTQKVLDYNPGNFDDEYYSYTDPLFNTYTVNNNTNLTYSLGFITIYPGLNLNIFPKTHLLIGSRIFINTSGEAEPASFKFSPAIQIEYSL